MPAVADAKAVSLGTTLAGSMAFHVAKTPGTAPVWSAVSLGSNGNSWEDEAR